MIQGGRQDMCWAPAKEIRIKLMFSNGQEYIVVGWPAKIYIHQLYVDTWCPRKDLPRVMANRNGRQEMSREFVLLAQFLEQFPRMRKGFFFFFFSPLLLSINIQDCPSALILIFYFIKQLKIHHTSRILSL